MSKADRWSVFRCDGPHTMSTESRLAPAFIAGPSRLSVRHASPFVRLAPDHLQMVFIGRSNFSDCGSCQAEAPIPASCSVCYFEMQLISGGRDR